MLELLWRVNKMKFGKRTKAIFIFLFLFLAMALLPYIPLWILRIDINKLSQSVKMWYNFVCDIVMLIITFLIFRKDTIRDFKNFFKKFFENFEISFKYYLVGFGIMVISNLLIVFLFKNANAGNEEAIRSLITLYPAYMIFSVALYAPFVEETIFRKTIKNIVLAVKDSKFNKYLYIFISGFIFASLHVIGTADAAVDYIYIVPYLGLGCAFAALYYKTDNIFCSIFMHALHNSAAIILYIALGIV